MAFDNDPELFIRPNGAAEALEKAKKDGKVRFVGFTGHHNAKVHLGMLQTGFPFDAVQMPLNAFDANFKSCLLYTSQLGIERAGGGHGVEDRRIGRSNVHH